MHNEPDPNAPYEQSDIRIKIIVVTFIVTIVLMFVAIVAMRAMDLDWQAGGLGNSIIALDRPEPTEAARRSPAPGPPAGPIIQSAPELDIAEHAAAQAKLRDSYGWVDKEAGIAHIPVSVAKEHVLNHGLPDWSHLNATEEGAQ